jgi:hypothetical protein
MHDDHRYDDGGKIITCSISTKRKTDHLQIGQALDPLTIINSGRAIVHQQNSSPSFPNSLERLSCFMDLSLGHSAVCPLPAKHMQCTQVGDRVCSFAVSTRIQLSICLYVYRCTGYVRWTLSTVRGRSAFNIHDILTTGLEVGACRHSDT